MLPMEPSVGSAGSSPTKLGAAAPTAGTTVSWSFDPLHVGVAHLPALESFCVTPEGVALLVIEPGPGERQRFLPLARSDLWALHACKAIDTVWGALQAGDSLRRERWVAHELERRERDIGSFITEVPLERAAALEVHLAALEPYENGDTEVDSRWKPKVDTRLFDARTPAGVRGALFEEVDKAPADLDLLEKFLRAALQWRESRPASPEDWLWQRALRGPALTAFWHLAARLGPERLDKACDDGQGKRRLLRVCRGSGVVFRGTCRAHFHRNLPPIQATARPISLGGHHLDARIGVSNPADPLARYNRQVRFSALCNQCGERFTTGDSRQLYCDACRTGAARVARSRLLHAPAG